MNVITKNKDKKNIVKPSITKQQKNVIKFSQMARELLLQIKRHNMHIFRR